MEAPLKNAYICTWANWKPVISPRQPCFLAKNPWIDGENIAIMGHSYGGFSAGISLLTHGDVFKAGIVASATANHLNYDNIYTERYMGLIGQNAEGYKQSSMITHAGQASGKDDAGPWTDG